MQPTRVVNSENPTVHRPLSEPLPEWNFSPLSEIFDDVAFLKRAERRKNLPRLSRMKSWQNWHIIHWIVWEAYSVVVKSVGWKEKWFLAESPSEIDDRADFPICPWDFFLCELSARFFSGRITTTIITILVYSCYSFFVRKFVVLSSKWDAVISCLHF